MLGFPRFHLSAKPFHYRSYLILEGACRGRCHSAGVKVRGESQQRSLEIVRSPQWFTLESHDFGHIVPFRVPDIMFTPGCH